MQFPVCFDPWLKADVAQLVFNYFRAEIFRSRSTMDSIRVSEAFDSGSIPDGTTT